MNIVFVSEFFPKTESQTLWFVSSESFHFYAAARDH